MSATAILGLIIPACVGIFVVANVVGGNRWHREKNVDHPH